jgi:DNA-binding protein HU-beta
MMNKHDLVDHTAEGAGLSKAAAAEAVDAMLDAIRDALAAGERVVIPGFGVFRRVTRAARKARNPATGATVDVPEKDAVSFRAGTGLQAAVGGTPE